MWKRLKSLPLWAKIILGLVSAMAIAYFVLFWVIAGLIEPYIG